MQRTSLAVLIAFLLTSVPVLAQTFNGKVTAITDGDTIKVLVKGLKGQREVKVRLHGIDCPESHQAFGTKAKQFTSSLAAGKQVTVDVRDTDKYGRTIADVMVDGKNLNAAIVENGFAWAYVQYSKEYLPQEKLARDAKKGLWADPNPTAPWDFRHGTAAKLTKPGAKEKQTSTARPTPSGPRRSVSTTNQTDTRSEATVFITRTGSKYHRDGCRYLSRSQIPIDIASARRSYSPCSVCQP